MSLPQELVDEILSYLSSDDEHGDWSLRNCSLVAKSWINPSRRYIFETVTIRERTFRSWLANIPPTNDGLLQHVCSLSLSFQSDNGFYIPPPVRRTDVLRDYFPSFYQLRHLSLSFIHLPSSISQQVDTFSAFRHTLSRLSLDDCKITTNALGTLLDYFPNLNRLDLSRIRHEVDAELAPPVSCPLVGRLCVSDLYWDNMGFFDQLSGLGLVFEEIIFNDCPFARPRFIGRVFSTVGVSAKRLRLLEPLQPGECITRQSGRAVGFANSETACYRRLESWCHNTSSLPRTPGNRDPCNLSGARGSVLRFFLQLGECSKGDLCGQIFILGW